jgi:hypothetical protein
MPLLVPLLLHAGTMICYIVQLEWAALQNGVPESEQPWEIGQWGPWVVASLVGFFVVGSPGYGPGEKRKMASALRCSQ